MKRSALFLCLAFAVVSCCTDPVTGKKYFCLYEVSDEDEVRLGEEYAPNFIAESGGIYPDPELKSLLSRIVIDDMAKRSHRPDLPWKFGRCLR